MTLNALDIVLLVVLVLVVVRASIIGFVGEFFSKAAVIFGILCSVMFFRRLSPFIVRLTGADSFTDAISFLLIFLVVYLAIKIIQQLVGKAFEGESMTNLNRAMGFFLGIGEGALLIMFAFFLMKEQPWFDLSFITKGSFLAGIFGSLFEGGINLLPGILLPR